MCVWRLVCPVFDHVRLRLARPIAWRQQHAASLRAETLVYLASSHTMYVKGQLNSTFAPCTMPPDLHVCPLHYFTQPDVVPYICSGFTAQMKCPPGVATLTPVLVLVALRGAHSVAWGLFRRR
jgi:hypothetical protein